MAEMVKVCLETEPRLCLSVPAKLAIAGVAGFLIGKLIVSALRSHKPTRAPKDRTPSRRLVRQ